MEKLGPILPDTSVPEDLAFAMLSWDEEDISLVFSGLGMNENKRREIVQNHRDMISEYERDRFINLDTLYTDNDKVVYERIQNSTKLIKIWQLSNDVLQTACKFFI